jgi:hypothetical protein
VRYVMAALVLLPTLALLAGMVRGRARVKGCCPPDPSSDLRMRP